MSTVYDLLKKWAVEQKLDADLLAHHLQKLELEDKIIPKLYSKDLDSDGKVHEILDIHEIEIKNLKGVHHRRLEIKPGITMVYGPNDAGKSTFLDGLELAIKGARGEAVPALMRCGAAEMEVKLRATACEIDRVYRRKVASRGKKAGEVTFEHDLVVSIDGSKDNKVEKAQGLLQDWCAVDLDFVVRSSMVRQGNLAGVLDEEASKRQALFFRLLAMDAAEDTRAAISKVAAAQAAKLGAQQTQLEPMTTELAELKAKLQQTPVDQIKTKVAELEAVVGGAGGSRVDREARISLISRAIAQHEKFVALRDKYKGRIADFNKSPALFLEVLDVAPKQAHAELALRGAYAGVAQLEERLATCKAHGSGIKREGICPVCKNLCGHATKEESIGRLKMEYGKIESELESYKAARSEQEQAFTHWTNERIRMATVSATKAGIQQSVSVLVELQCQLDVVIDAFDYKRAKADVESLTRAIGVDAGDPKLAEELADYRRYLAEADALRSRIAGLEKAIAQVGSATTNGYMPAVLEQLQTAFSKKGMPLWIAQQHVGRVNAIAEEISAGDRYRYALGPELNVVIKDGELEVDPRAASGSSRQRGALVMLCAMALYLQELAQIRIPFLWIDEIPFQDEKNQHLIVELLRSIAKRVPKVIFGASQWDVYEGKFDHEVCVMPGVLEQPTTKTVAAAPIVKMHGASAVDAPPLSTLETVALDAPDRIATKARELESFEQLEQRLTAPLPAAAVDPLTQDVPAVVGLDMDDDDPF